MRRRRNPWRYVAIGLGLVLLAHWIGDDRHRRRTIIVVPVMVEQGGTLVPADPETGASDAPSAPFLTRDL